MNSRSPGIRGGASIGFTGSLADGADVILRRMPADTGFIVRRLQAIAGGVPAQCRNVGNGAIGINDLFARLAVVKTRIAAAGGHIGIVRIRHMALVAAAAAVFGSHKYLTAAIGIAGSAAHRTQIIIISVAAGLAVPVGRV